MRILVIFALALLIAGCGAPAQPAENKSQDGAMEQPPAQQPPPAQPPAQPPPPPQAVPPPAQPPPSVTPAPQQECATLTPNCGSCIAKAGCGWCKSSSACFSGNADGPAGDIQCQPADWATTEEECQAPSSPQGTKCAEQFGCGNCLSGEGCKFCRQGAVCADITSTDDCFGGWLTEFYQCAAGSQ
jgi:hypothetical protein